jgi:hypothetical protein
MGSCEDGNVVSGSLHVGKLLTSSNTSSFSRSSLLHRVDFLKFNVLEKIILLQVNIFDMIQIRAGLSRYWKPALEPFMKMHNDKYLERLNSMNENTEAND